MAKKAVSNMQQEIMDKELTVAVVVGHCHNAPGSYSNYLGTEFDYNSDIASKLTEVADIYFYDNFDKGYHTTVKNDLSPKIKNYNVGFELHFNDYINTDVQGVEAWYWHSNKKGKKIAEYYCKKISEKFDIYNRGAKAIKSKYDRGGASIYYPSPTMLILEPCFGRNKEAEKFKDIEKHIEVVKDVIKYAKNI